MKQYVLAVLAILSLSGAAANAACTVPNTLTNGTTADANPVMANFTAMANCVNSIPVLRGYISGLQLSAAGGTTTYGIASGMAANSTATAYLPLASNFTKTAASWVVGSGNGSLDTGSIANSTWYHVFVIQRPDTGVVDILVSLSATAPTLPANYTLFRRIGAMASNGSGQWRAFVQSGDEFIWTGTLQNLSIGMSSSRALVTADVPTGVRVRAKFQGYAQDAVSNSGSNFFIQSPDMTSGSFGIGAMTSSYPVVGVDNVTLTNTNAQVYMWIAGSAPFPLVRIDMPGWFDDRGKN